MTRITTTATLQKAPERSKAEIRKVALQLLQAKGFEVWRNNNVAIPGRKFIGRRGVPDIVGFDMQGMWVVAEVKTLRDKLSQDQIDFLNMLKKRGGHTYLAVQDEKGNIVLKEY